MKSVSYIKEQRNRRRLSAFKELIESPASQTAKLPADGRFAVRSNSGTIAGALALTVVSTRTFNVYTKTLISGQMQLVDNLPKDCVVTVEEGFSLMFDIGIGKFVPIING